LPETGDSPPAVEPTGQGSAAQAPEGPVLSRLDLELPDGRYLLAYRRRPQTTAADA
jgi:hypothetical protein